MVAPQQRLPNNTVRPDNTPLHQKRGWIRRSNIYQGYFRTRYGAWRGEIERHGDKFKVFIYSPPREQLSKHSRWQCFHQEGRDKWRIHLAVNPKDGDVGAIVFFVEKLVIDSFRL
jgi:hypothetical protein